MRTVFPIIAGPADIRHAEDLPFRNLKDLTDGSISKAQSDFYDGSRPSELKGVFGEDLGPFIVPSISKSAPCLSNFFAEGRVQIEVRLLLNVKLYMTVLWVLGG